MKITKRQLRRIIKEEKAQHESIKAQLLTEALKAKATTSRAQSAFRARENSIQDQDSTVAKRAHQQSPSELDMQKKVPREKQTQQSERLHP